ncbi:MAG: hypothetical protein ACXADB_10510 [Candidatus Hermodarchaeia archaeon]
METDFRDNEAIDRFHYIGDGSLHCCGFVVVRRKSFVQLKPVFLEIRIVGRCRDQVADNQEIRKN